MFIKCTEKCVFQSDGECTKENCYVENSVSPSNGCVYEITKKSSEAHRQNGQTSVQRPNTSF